jgi:hypothetical protein
MSFPAEARRREIRASLSTLNRVMSSGGVPLLLQWGVRNWKTFGVARTGEHYDVS